MTTVFLRRRPPEAEMLTAVDRVLAAPEEIFAAALSAGAIVLAPVMARLRRFDG